MCTSGACRLSLSSKDTPLSWLPVADGISTHAGCLVAVMILSEASAGVSACVNATTAVHACTLLVCVCLHVMYGT